MARISSYPRDLEVNNQDAWIGTESSNRLTRNFTAQAVADYLNIQGKISISGQMIFKFIEPPIAGGSFVGPADDSPISSISTLDISGIDAGGQNTVAFMQYLVGSNILISEQNNIDSFGHFTVDSYVFNDPIYTLNLTNIAGNGDLQINKYYDFAAFTLSADSGDKNFIFVQAVPSATWTVVHNLNKYPSVTVINNNNFVLYGEVEYIDINTLTITFSGGFSGKAYLN
jgi:hypothetical protein